MKTILKNETETVEAGKKLGETLKGGDVVLLYGDLGAGKTTFAKGIAAGLGIKEEITSPTFTLMNVYADGKLVHIDTYRMEDKKELEKIGALDYIGNPLSITLIEWPEKILPLLTSKHAVSVTLKHAQGDRILNIT